MGCCCCGKKAGEFEEYVCAVHPEKCPPKKERKCNPVPECCGKPMKKK